MKRPTVLLTAGLLIVTSSSLAFAQPATGSGKATGGFSVSAPAGAATSGKAATANPNNGTPMNEPAQGLNTTPGGAATTSGNTTGTDGSSGNVTTGVGGANASGGEGFGASGATTAK
jgi:hypothetical protein